MLINQLGRGYAPGTNYVLSERAKGAKSIHFMDMANLKISPLYFFHPKGFLAAKSPISII
jgi:hypothetical protein